MICNVHAALATVRRFYRVFTPAVSETWGQMDGNGERFWQLKSWRARNRANVSVIDFAWSDGLERGDLGPECSGLTPCYRPQIAPHLFFFSRMCRRNWRKVSSATSLSWLYWLAPGSRLSGSCHPPTAPCWRRSWTRSLSAGEPSTGRSPTGSAGIKFSKTHRMLHHMIIYLQLLCIDVRVPMILQYGLDRSVIYFMQLQ